MDNIARWIDTKTNELGSQKMHAVVAGAGFVGLEMVEQLVARGIHVTLVEMMNQILGPFDVEMAALLHKDLEERGVTVIVGDGIKQFDADKNDPTASALTLQSGRVLSAAHMTILGLGVRPDTAVVKAAGVDVTPRGHIVVNEHL